MKLRLLPAGCLVAAVAAGWIFGWYLKPSFAEKPVDRSGPRLATDAGGLRAKIIFNTPKEKWDKIDLWNRAIQRAARDETVNKFLPADLTSTLAREDESENPLVQSTFFAAVQITNPGDLPVLLIKGHGYKYNQDSQYTRNHEIFVDKDGVAFKNKKYFPLQQSIDLKIPYPEAGSSNSAAFDSVLLNPYTSVKDDFWLVGPEFEFDTNSAGTYRIKGRVKVCLLPTLEQVELTTDEIEITITDEHVRQYKTRQSARK